MNATCLNQIELARRWKVSPRTLERWRWLSQGPRYLKLGGRVLYRVSDIEAYERSIIRLTQADAEGSRLGGVGSNASPGAGATDANGGFSLHAHSFPNNHARAGQDGETHSILGRIG
jgi:hypothetical protein